MLGTETEICTPGQHQSEQLATPARLPQASHRGRGGYGIEHIKRSAYRRSERDRDGSPQRGLPSDQRGEEAADLEP